MSFAKDPVTPPPVIGKIGPYTVFLSPPQPPETPQATAAAAIQPPVKPPPAQFDQSADDRLGFLRNAVSTVQHAHSSIDEYMANWLGLNQSKYQWALDDYFESKGLEKDSKTKEVSSTAQSV